jgi:hypothetical protein
MATAETSIGLLSESDHRLQLRRAVIASTIRSHDRMVRFPALQHRDRAAIRQALFPRIGPVYRGMRSPTTQTRTFPRNTTKSGRLERAPTD